MDISEYALAPPRMIAATNPGRPGDGWMGSRQRWVAWLIGPAGSGDRAL